MIKILNATKLKCSTKTANATKLYKPYTTTNYNIYILLCFTFQHIYLPPSLFIDHLSINYQWFIQTNKQQPTKKKTKKQKLKVNNQQQTTKRTNDN